MCEKRCKSCALGELIEHNQSYEFANGMISRYFGDTVLQRHCITTSDKVSQDREIVEIEAPCEFHDRFVPADAPAPDLAEVY